MFQLLKPSPLGSVCGTTKGIQVRFRQPVSTEQVFDNKTIALGICGGIAAYKACDLIRELYRQGAKQVIPILTASAEAFVTPTTLQSLARGPVYAETLGMTHDGVPTHIALAQQADVLLILPATANVLGKLAHGIADDLLSTTFLTFSHKPVLIAPAMNTRMWRHPMVQENLKKLAALFWVDVVSPISGDLACGETGEGHLAEPEMILAHLRRALHPEAGLYEGKKALISAGGTVEAIDPVRLITNRSSGKMGKALADELWAMGAEVTLVSTKILKTPVPYEVLVARTAEDLAHTLHREFPESDLLLMAAAVSDYKVVEPSPRKIKRQSKPNMVLKLDSNVDILASLAAIKTAQQQVVGFAAESHDMKQYALEKLKRKKLDALVANDVSRDDIGFHTDDNEVTLFFKDGASLFLPKAPKSVIARQILTELYARHNTPKTKPALGQFQKV